MDKNAKLKVKIIGEYQNCFEVEVEFETTLTKLCKDIIKVVNELDFPVERMKEESEELSV